MHWTFAAAFTLHAETDRWLLPFVPGERHQFTLIPAIPPPAKVSWHRRSRPATGLREWASAWRQGAAAWHESHGGVVTVFPQLAVTVGACQRLSLDRKPIVAWCFNMGALHGGVKGAVARSALARIDRFVVHSRAEVSRYARWLHLPLDRFCFVPLQRAPILVEESEDQQRPFVLAMGSARRDYRALLEAVRRLKVPTLIVAAPHALQGLSLPDNVEVRGGLSAHECHLLAQRARVNVVPVLNEETSSGQVTVIEAMRMGRAVVATRCMGTVDYVEDGNSGLLVEPRSSDALCRAIGRLWADRELRERLGRSAARFTAEHCSDEAAGRALKRVLDEVQEAHERRC